MTTPEPPSAMLAVTVIVHFVESDCVTEVTIETFVKMKSLAVTVAQSMASSAVSANEADVLLTIELTAAKVSTGAVTSAIVTTTDAGEPDAMTVRLLPYASATEKPAEARRLDVPDEPGDTDELAVIVHRVDVVCAMTSIESISVNVKSDATTDPQAIGSLPVSVNVIVELVDVGDEAESTSVGGVWSTTVNVLSIVAVEYPSVCAAVTRTTHVPVPEYVSERVFEVMEHESAVVDTTAYEIAPLPVVLAAAIVWGDSSLSSVSDGDQEIDCESRLKVNVASAYADEYVAV